MGKNILPEKELDGCLAGDWQQLVSEVETTDLEVCKCPCTFQPIDTISSADLQKHAKTIINPLKLMVGFKNKVIPDSYIMLYVVMIKLG